MPAPLGPLRFVPFLRPMVWGGRDLASALHKTLPTEGAYGESWEVSDHALHRSVVAAGPWQGATLRQLMDQERRSLLGSAADRFDTFPWLIKFLDCCAWLSVQVHPDAEAVKTLWPGEGSKTEAWYVIDARPTSRIYAGLRPGVGPTELREALARGTVAECLHSFVPTPGDCVYLPAGAVHAVGGGVLLAEIQETSDATFRLFDWNRVDAEGKPRKLHVDAALAAIHWEYGPVAPRRSSAAGGCHVLVGCAAFELALIHCSSEMSCAGGRLQCLILLEGEGRWETGEILRPGQVWVLPASMTSSRVRLSKPLRALLVTLP